MHTKDLLVNLSTELKVNLNGSSKNEEMIKQLLKADTKGTVPKVLAKAGI